MDPFNPTELRVRLTELGARPDCPFCGNTKWASPLANEKNLLTVGDMTAAPLICAQCGFVRWVDLFVLDPQGTAEASNGHLH